MDVLERLLYKMDQVRFHEACDKIILLERQTNGIGTLGEKTLHAILKNYYEPDIEKQEIRMCGYVADIVNENGVVEIQTRSFDKLRKKLEQFLEISEVTIVYPIPHVKWLRWIDEESGEMSKPRKSPRKGTPYMIFPELYKIKSYLCHPNLNLCIAMIDMEEFKLLNGWSQDKKKGSSRYDRVPLELIEEICIKNQEEYQKLIPESLEEEFTAKDFQKASKISLGAARTAMNVLNHVEAVVRVGKKGNAFIYKRNI